MLKKIVIIFGSLSLMALILIVSLFNGIKIDNISTSSANINELYLKYDKKLIISIKELDILPSTDDETTKFDPSYIMMAKTSLSYIQSIEVGNINVENYHLDLNYKDNSLKIKSDLANIDLDFTLFNNKADFNATIKNKDLLISIVGDLNNNILNYNISTANIEDIQFIEKYTKLSSKLHILINEQLKFNYIKLNYLKGMIDIDDPATIDTKNIVANFSIATPSLKYEKNPKLILNEINVDLKNNNIFVNIIKSEQKEKDTLTLDGNISTTIAGKNIIIDTNIYYEDIIFHTYDTIKNNTLKYSLSSSSIKDIAIFQKFVPFPSSIKTWAIDRLKSRSTTIEKVTGKIELDPFKVDFSTLRVDVVMDDIIMDFNPNKAYPLEAKRLKMHFDGKNMDMLLDQPISNDVNLSGSKAQIYDMFGNSGLYLDLKTISPLNKTLVRSVASYGVDIVNDLKIKQIQGTSDIKVNINIPFGSNPLDIKVSIKNKNSTLSVKDQNISFENLNFIYAQNKVMIQNSKLSYQNYDIGINDMVFDIPTNILDLNTTLQDNKKLFLVDILNHTNLKTKNSSGDIFIDYIDINNSVNIKNKKIPYLVSFDKSINASLPTLGINYIQKDKIQHLSIDELTVFEDMIVGMENIALKSGSLDIKADDFNDIDIDLSMISKPYHQDMKYNINLNTKINLDTNSSKGNLVLNRLKYKDITNVTNTTIPFDINFGQKLQIELSSLNTTLTKDNNLTKITIADLRDYGKIITKLDDFNLTKTSIIGSMQNSDNIDLSIGLDIAKYNIFHKNKKLENITLDVNIKDQHRLKISNKDNIILANLDLNQQEIIRIDIADIGIEYNNTNITKYEKNIQLYPPKCKAIKFDLPKVKLSMTNGYVKYNSNMVNYDNINLATDKSKLNLNLQDRNTTIKLELNQDKISLKSTNIDNIFLNNLIANRMIGSGYLDMNITGNQCNLDGNITLHQIDVKNVAILKNIFLVINSAPALVNPLLIIPNAYRLASDGFNLTQYQLKKGKIDFNLNRNSNLLDINNLYLEGVYSDFIAKSRLNLWKKTIVSNVDVVFMKDYSKIIDFVPGLGYIILGDEKRFSYSVDIVGDIEDPKVKTYMTKETILAPFNIIKRVVTFPFESVSQ